jgi:3-methylcrotonyl-CoA carboxylase alpha subunit
MEYYYERNGIRYAVTLSQQADGSFTVSIGENVYTVQVQRLPDGTLNMHIDGQDTQAWAASQADTRYIAVRHNTVQHYNLERIHIQTKQRSRGSVMMGQILAQMPGQVVTVDVAAGDVVAAGSTLLVLEAMKMEIRVQVSTDGTVDAVLVDVGQSVERGQELVRITAAET